VRTTCEFEILFENGVYQWQTCSKDLSGSSVFEDYIQSKPELSPLIYETNELNIFLRLLNTCPISNYVSLGDTVYVDLRTYSATWYQSLQLPNCERLTYVVPYQYQSWVNHNNHKKSKGYLYSF
jgi:hypothetical protein